MIHDQWAVTGDLAQWLMIIARWPRTTYECPRKIQQRIFCRTRAGCFSSSVGKPSQSLHSVPLTYHFGEVYAFLLFEHPCHAPVPMTTGGSAISWLAKNSQKKFTRQFVGPKAGNIYIYIYIYVFSLYTCVGVVEYHVAHLARYRKRRTWDRRIFIRQVIQVGIC